MIRLIKPEEIPTQLAKFKSKYPWAPDPQWEGVLVKTNGDGNIVAIAELQQRVLIATLDGDTPRYTDEMMAAVDGWLARGNINQYEFEVPEANERMIKFLEGNGLKPTERAAYRMYVVKRYPDANR